MGGKRKDKHLPKCMYLKSGRYYLVKNNKWRDLGVDRRDAFLRYEELTRDPNKFVLMKDLFRRYELEVLPKYSNGTRENQRYSLATLDLAFGKHSPDLIKPSDVYRYIDKRGEYSKNWANKDKAVLSNVFQNAIRWGAVESNPCREVKGFSIAARTRLIKQEEFDFVYNMSNNLIKNSMLFAYYTKARQGDILNLRLEDIKDGYIRIKQSKTGKELLIELSEKLSQLITKIKSEKKIHSFYLFSSSRGEKYKSSGFKSIWQRAMDRAMEKGLKERFTFHDIRAMAITYTAKIHGIKVASEAAGHADEKVTRKHYYRDKEAKKVKATE